MQTEEILLEYEKRKWIRRYAGIGFLVAEVAWIATANGWLVERWLLIGGVILLALLLFLVTWRYWRCPACGRLLGRDEPKHCPECGTRLVA